MRWRYELEALRTLRHRRLQEARDRLTEALRRTAEAKRRSALAAEARASRQKSCEDIETEHRERLAGGKTRAAEFGVLTEWLRSEKATVELMRIREAREAQNLNAATAYEQGQRAAVIEAESEVVVVERDCARRRAEHSLVMARVADQEIMEQWVAKSVSRGKRGSQ